MHFYFLTIFFYDLFEHKKYPIYLTSYLFAALRGKGRQKHIFQCCGRDNTDELHVMLCLLPYDIYLPSLLHNQQITVGLLTQV